MSTQDISDSELLAEYRSLFYDTHEQLVIERILSKRLDESLQRHVSELENLRKSETSAAQAKSDRDDTVEQMQQASSEWRLSGVDGDRPPETAEEVTQRHERMRAMGVRNV